MTLIICFLFFLSHFLACQNRVSSLIYLFLVWKILLLWLKILFLSIFTCSLIYLYFYNYNESILKLNHIKILIINTSSETLFLYLLGIFSLFNLFLCSFVFIFLNIPPYVYYLCFLIFSCTFFFLLSFYLDLILLMLIIYFLIIMHPHYYYINFIIINWIFLIIIINIFYLILFIVKFKTTKLKMLIINYF